MSKAKMAAAKELIQEKRYEEARQILATVDHPTAREWEQKLNRLAPPIPAPPPMPVQTRPPGWQPPYMRPDNTRGLRIWRNVWGVLTLLSFGWICYGLVISSTAYGEVATGATSATQAGAAIGASLGLGVFLCTGLPFALLFLYAYGRAGASIRTERQHQEMMDAVGMQQR